MPEEELRNIFDEEEDFDPLEVNDGDIDQEDMDDDNPYDTVDYPTMREMPQHMRRPAVYTPEVQGSADAAIRGLFDRNPQRRPVFRAIINACRGGCPSSTVVQIVDEVQNDNRSVYEPMTLCRMLERAGALTLETPKPAQDFEDVEEGVTYLTIGSEVDPVWTATPEALAIVEEHEQGGEFKDLVLTQDVKYLDVYKAVLNLVAQAPRKREEIDETVDTFEIVQNPRRFGEHFIDVLEHTDAITWHNHRWTITNLGRTMLSGLNAQ